jgi:hypothetical protein
MMPIPIPAVDDTFRDYAELLLRRHNLLLAGKEDDAEMGEVEERLSIIWEKLSEDQRLSLNGMASDLNWVRRRGTPPPKGRKPEEVTEQDRKSLAEAEMGEDWSTVLHYLRVCAPVLDTPNLARKRAAAYAGFGFPLYAELCGGLGSPTNGSVAVSGMSGRDGLVGRKKTN